MKAKPFTIVMHALVWMLLLVIPYASTDQIFDSFDLKYLLLCLVLSGVLISIFYFNYLILIPRYLLTKRYFRYFSFLVLAISLVAAVLILVFTQSDLRIVKQAATDPVIERIIPVILINTILLWLLSIISSTLWSVHNRLKHAETERLTAQIASLKSQINPHFLFNTLNNIYASTIDLAPTAADMVDKLAEMMRYTMKDTQQDLVLLEDEINYVDNFIELQKLRLDRNVKLEYQTINIIPELRIAPMLLIPFIENAFKHGVNSEQKSHIKIELSIENSELQLRVCNNKVNIQRDISERSGLGIENTQHRLDLVYPSRHMLVIKETDREFMVSLYISLQ